VGVRQSDGPVKALPEAPESIEDVIQEARMRLNVFKASRERSLAATKLDEFEMWVSRCELNLDALVTEHHKEE
jgi:hypothetical protein